MSPHELAEQESQFVLTIVFSCQAQSISFSVIEEGFKWFEEAEVLETKLGKIGLPSPEW